MTPPWAVRTIDLVTLAGGLGALLLHRLDALGACVVVAQTACLLGLVAILEISATRPERGHGEAKPGPPDPPEAGSSAERRVPAPDDSPAPWLGERLRRLALGLTAALLTARAYWPSEPDFLNDAGTGLDWVFALLVVAGLAIASSLVGGTLRVRFSWVDAAVAVLIVLVASSASHALDRRPAINLAWEWVALGVAYFLVRNLPRTRGESTVLAGAMVATAVAVSAYGMFQVGVEQEQLRRYYESHTVEALREAGITPGTPAQKLFEDRVLRIERGVFDLRPGELAGRVPARAADPPRGGRLGQPPAPRGPGLPRSGAGTGRPARRCSC